MNCFYFATAMASFRDFDLLIKYKGKEGRVYNVDPDRYCYFDLLEDVYASVLSNLPSNESFATKLVCDVPGSDIERLIENDLDVLDMFYMQGRSSRTIIISVDVSYCTPILSLEGNEEGLDLGVGGIDDGEGRQHYERVDLEDDVVDGEGRQHYERVDLEDDVVNGENRGNEERQDLDENDYVYGFSDEEKDWNFEKENEYRKWKWI